MNFTQSSSLEISSICWEHILYYFSTAIMPILLISALVAALVEVRIFMLRSLQLKIEPSSKFYYLTISLTIAGSILIHQLPNDFVLKNLSFYFPAIYNIETELSQIFILCDTFRMNSVLFHHCIGWFYLLLESFTLLKILHPTPIGAKSLFQGHCIHFVLLFLVVSSGLLVSVGFVIANHSSHLSTDCMMDLDDFMNLQIFRYLLATDVSIGPYILTLAISIYLLLIIRQRVGQTAPLVNCRGFRGRNFSNVASHTQLADGIVAVMLSLAHFATNFPVGVCYSLECYFNAQPDSSSQRMAEILAAIYVVLSPLENLDAILDFIIYTIRIPAFRTILFGKWCCTSNLN